MKKVLILIVLLATLVSARTEKITLERYESFRINDKNVTLLNLDKSNDKIVVCVNNVQGIVSKEKLVNGAMIDLRSVSKDKATLSIEVNSQGDCTGECDNSLCLECIENSDCNDHNEATTDSCVYDKCVFKRTVSEKSQEEAPTRYGERLPIEVKAKVEDVDGAGENTLLLFSFIVISIIVVIVIASLIKGRKAI